MTIDWDAQEDQTPSKAGWYARPHDNGQKAECYWDGQESYAKLSLKK